MTLRFYDSIDLYGSVSDMEGGGFVFVNPSDVVVDVANGRTGLGHFAVRDQGEVMVMTDSTVAIDVPFYVSFAFRMDSLPLAATNPFLEIRASGNDMVFLRISPAGAIEVWREATMLGTTADGLVSAATWHHLEVRVLNDTVNGEVSLVLGDFEVLSLIGVDTQVFDGGTPDMVSFYRGVDAAVDYTRFDDVVMWDADGSGNFSDVSHGDIILAPLAVNSDVEVQTGYGQAGGGAFYEELEEVIPGSNDGDSTYIETDATAAGGSPASAVFGHAGSPSDVGEVLAVGVIAEVRKTANGVPTATDFVVRGDLSGAPANVLADPLGAAAISPSLDFMLVRSEPLLVDPSTSSAWSKSGVDDAGFGINFNGL